MKRQRQDSRMSSPQFLAPESTGESSTMAQQTTSMEVVTQPFRKPPTPSAFVLYNAANKEVGVLYNEVALLYDKASALYLQACSEIEYQRATLVAQVLRRQASLLCKNESSLRQIVSSRYDQTLPPLRPSLSLRELPIATSSRPPQFSSMNRMVEASGSSAYGGMSSWEDVSFTSSQTGIMTPAESGTLSPTMGDIGDFLPIVDDQDSLVNRNKALSPLCALPSEILLEIMSYLPLPSLYIFRQASVIFTHLFLDRIFRGYRIGNGKSTGWVNFRLTILGTHERVELFRNLAKDRFCKACLDAWVNGERLRKARTALQHRPCRRCDDGGHDGLLCLPCVEDTSGRITRCGDVCIGQIMGVNVCNHPHNSTVVVWENIEGMLDAGTKVKQYTVRCNERHACMGLPAGPNPEACAPQMKVEAYTKSSLQITLSWDVSMMRVSSFHAVTAIRDHLLLMVGVCLLTWRPCKHVVAEDIRNLITSGVCECFTEAGHKDIPKVAHIWGGSRFMPNECKERHSYKCKFCSASYALRLEGGYVYLSYRKETHVARPSSLEWLRLLDESSYFIPREEDTKHYLWCDSVGCQTNRRDRLLKEYEYELAWSGPWKNVRGLPAWSL